jgi:hypothetical protein
VAEPTTSDATDPNREPAASDPWAQRRFSKPVTRVIQGVLVAVMLVPIVVGVRYRMDNSVPVLPDTKTTFSLDLEVIATMDHDVVYAVEQRSRPGYRILSFDPATGGVETVFTVPKDAIIYGIALRPDGKSLAVAYSPDFSINGSGLWTLDLDTRRMSEVTPAMKDVYLTDPAWSADSRSMLATRVDRTGQDDSLDIAQVALADGGVDIIVNDGIAPTLVGGIMFYLTVDHNQARRSIGVLGRSGESSTIVIGEGEFDLDHLLAGADPESLRFAVLDAGNSGGLALGQSAQAHGNHDIPSTWWDVSTRHLPTGESSAEATKLEPIVVYDAVSTGTDIVYATKTGLSIADSARTDLIKSRAIRFVAG